VFGRRKREEAAAEAAREAERRALFARLAERPEHICPFLGLVDERTGYVDGVSEDHRCYAFGDPAPLSAEQQTRVCQERGYGNCPRYLRGVLVIPTEELEALRHPRPMPEAAPPPPPAEPRRRRRPLIALLLVILLVAAVGGGGWLAVRSGLIALGPASPTPEPTASEVVPTDPATASPTATSEQTQTPLATPTIEPTPAPGDEFAFYEVSVAPGSYTVYRLDEAGELIGTQRAGFTNFSKATVERVELPDGTVHWRTIDGDYAGLSYIYPDSGPFQIRAIYLTPDGDRSAEYLPEEEL
jgi:hypothetical protein